jgi:hypothetical protein
MGDWVHLQALCLGVVLGEGKLVLVLKASAPCQCRDNLEVSKETLLQIV